MLTVNSNRFDKYRILFTDNQKDERPRLFLSLLHEAAEKKVEARVKSNPANLSAFIPDDNNMGTVFEEMKVASFDASSPLHKFIVDDAIARSTGKTKTTIHPEWVAFSRDLIRYLSNPVSEQVKTLIRSIKMDPAGPLGLNNYVINLIKSMFVIKNTAGTDLTQSEDKWATASIVEANLGDVIQKILKFAELYYSIIVKSGNNSQDAKAILDSTTIFGGGFVNTAQQEITKNYNMNAAVDVMTSTLDFGYKIDKFVVQKWLEAYVASKSSGDVVESAFFAEENQSASIPDFYRNTTGELMMVNKDANGKLTGVDTKIDKTSLIKLAEDNNCLTTGVTDDGTSTCASYLRTCLLNGDISKCKTFLLNPNFWPQALNEVRKINPFVAVETLKAFEYETEHHSDSQWGKILKVEQVQSWLERLQNMTKSDGSKLLDAAEFKKISKNDRLIGYLGMLVQKINNSPAILNKHVTSAGPQVVNQDRFKDTHFGKLGVKFNPSSTSVLSDTQKTIMSTRQKMDRIAISLQLPQLAGLSVPFILRGGSQSKIGVLSQRYTESGTQLWYQMNLEYKGLTQRLNASGKAIDANDHNRINQLIEDLKTTEKKLYKSILYAEKYADLIEVYGEKDNSSVLSFNHLKQFVDMRNQYFERVTKKQSALTSIIQAVAEAVVKETSRPKQATQTVGKTKLSVDSFF